MTPQRIQRRRSAGWRMPAGVVYVGRPTRWGNSAPVIDGNRGAAVEAYRQMLIERPDLVAAIRTALVGRDLACWCPMSGPCHADVLLAVAAGIDPRDFQP